MSARTDRRVVRLAAKRAAKHAAKTDAVRAREHAAHQATGMTRLAEAEDELQASGLFDHCPWAPPIVYIATHAPVEWARAGFFDLDRALGRS